MKRAKMYLGIYYKFPIVQTIFKIQFLNISTPQLLSKHLDLDVVVDWLGG